MSDGFYGSGPPWHQDPPWPEEPGDPSGGGVDEEALRRMLQSAVDGLEPTPGSLEYLQRAVPARRARRRQLVVGSAAAVILIGTAVPTLMYATKSPGDDGRRDTAVSSQEPGQDRQGGSGGGDGGSSAGASEEPGQQEDHDKATRSPGPGEESANPTGSPEAGVPPCEPTQFGEPASSSGQPDAAGRVTGQFTVSNVSDSTCTVEDPGGVQVGTLGAARVSQIDSRTHEDGDGATGLLPAPGTEPSQIVLEPGSSYAVQFAWVPETTDGNGGCTSDDSTPTPGTSEDPPQSEPDSLAEPETTSETETGGSTGGTEDPEEPVEGSVTLTHTPEGDVNATASASVTVDNACAGTVYYTGALPGS